MVHIGCAMMPFVSAVIIGWAALACLVLLLLWFPAAALDWHISMPRPCLEDGGGEMRIVLGSHPDTIVSRHSS